MQRRAPRDGFGYSQALWSDNFYVLATQSSTVGIPSGYRREYRHQKCRKSSLSGGNSGENGRRTTQYVPSAALCVAGGWRAGSGTGAGRRRHRPCRRQCQRHHRDGCGFLDARPGQRCCRCRREIDAPVTSGDVAHRGAAPERERRCRQAGTDRRHPVHTFADASGDCGGAGVGRRVGKCREAVGQ